MCSIVEDDFGDEGGAHGMKEDTPQPDLTPNELCRKCNTEVAVLKLDRKEPQCRQCFLNYVRHKFRASLGSSKIVRRGSRVLVIFNGAGANVTLLDMIRYGLEQDAFKQLRIVPVVLYVDDGFIGNRDGSRTERIAKHLDVLKQFKGFTCYYAVCGSTKYVELALSEDNSLPLNEFEQDEERLMAALNSVQSVTGKQDLLEVIRKKTYRHVASALNCNYVFLSDIGIDLAKTLLSNVALGRGCSLAQDVAFCDDRDQSVKLIRPIRDLNPDEVDNYLKLSETMLRWLEEEKYFLDKPSLQNLTAKFIDNLQQSFPSTVSTVFRTGDKLDVQKMASHGSCSNSPPGQDTDLLTLLDNKLTLNNGDVQQSNGRCTFCHATLDYRGSKTLFATEYSRLVSSRVNASNSHEEILQKSKQMELDAERAVNGEQDDHKQLMKQLCHGCRNIFVDIGG